MIKHLKSINYTLSLMRKNIKLTKNTFEAQYELSQDTTINAQSNLTATNVFLKIISF